MAHQVPAGDDEPKHFAESRMETNERPLPERLKAAAELLEQIAANRALLAGVPEADRTRLLQAAGQVSRPDALARRRLVKVTLRQRKAAKRDREQVQLNDTGIRKLRREKVFTTPNVFPPLGFEQQEVQDDPEFREALEPQNCYVCKQDYSLVHHFYDQLCPLCAEQ